MTYTRATQCLKVCRIIASKIMLSTLTKMVFSQDISTFLCEETKNLSQYRKFLKIIRSEFSKFFLGFSKVP